jgi:FtsZ-interacting cell division protein YlmF
MALIGCYDSKSGCIVEDPGNDSHGQSTSAAPNQQDTRKRNPGTKNKSTQLKWIITKHIFQQLIQEQSATSRPVRRTNFNTSMCLAPEDFDKQQQWYDRDRIRSSIENPSIANMRETRSYFEQATQADDFKSWF